MLHKNKVCEIVNHKTMNHLKLMTINFAFLWSPKIWFTFYYSKFYYRKSNKNKIFTTVNFENCEPVTLSPPTPRIEVFCFHFHIKFHFHDISLFLHLKRAYKKFIIIPFIHPFPIFFSWFWRFVCTTKTSHFLRRFCARKHFCVRLLVK